MTEQYKKAYFETLWVQLKPAKRMPIEFEQRLKDSVFTMMESVWNSSRVTERDRIKAEFSDFVDGNLSTPYLYPSAK